MSVLDVPYMVVAYFTNFTGTFPEECDGHTPRPAQSYDVLFNTAPWWLKVITTTACVALPYNVRKSYCKRGGMCVGVLNTVTQLVKVESSILGHVMLGFHKLVP